MMRRLLFAVTMSLLTAPVFAQEPAPSRNRFKQDLAGSEEVERFMRSFKGNGAIGDDSTPTPPEEAIKLFKLEPGLALDLVANEPAVAQPIHINFDERGRMWVVQYLQYPFPAGLKVVRYDQYLRAQFDKVPEPPPHGTPGADKITVWEDTDGDGTYDIHKDVITGLNIATASVTGRGGIWVLNTPYLLFYPDANGDDVPDGPPEVHLSGFGLEDTHAVANSLTWGPDGWLYGANGSTTTGRVSSANSQNVSFQGQCLWRYHPTAKLFEVFAEGGGNTFSLEFDSKGRFFSGTNHGNTRGMYYPQGSYGIKGWAKHGPLTNPYAFGWFEHMRHEGDDVRFPQTFCIYEGTALPDLYRGTIISANSLHNRVWASQISPDGSTWKTKDLPDPITSLDHWFRPVDIKVGPDGAVYLADWYDTRLTHVDPRDNWHKSSGRIYRLRGTEPKWATPVNLSKMSDAELIGLLKHPNKWQRQTAVRLLGERAAGSTRTLLEKLAVSTEEGALEALWALHWRGWFTEELALNLLGHPDEDVRRWTIRLLGDWRKINSSTASRLAHLARDEQQIHVRSQLAASAKRFPAQYAMPIIRGLLAHPEDANDPHMPLMTWWAIEAHCGSDHQAVLSLLEEREEFSKPLMVSKLLPRIMQRFALEAIQQTDQPARREACFATCLTLFKLARTDEEKQALSNGFLEAFAGRDLSAAPEELRSFLTTGSSEAEALIVAMKLGETEAVTKALKLVAPESTPASTRIPLIEALGQSPRPNAVPVLLRLLGSPSVPVKRAALQSLMVYDDPSVGPTVCSRWHTSIPDELDLKSTTLRLLGSRATWSKDLVKEVAESRIPATTVTLDVVQQMRLHNDPDLNKLLDRYWGQTRSTSEEKQQQIDRLTQLIRQKEAADDPARTVRGQALFSKHCGTCHTLFGQGGQTGPNLTGYDREKLDFLAVAIVDPSAAIREEFTQFGIATADGRVLTGLIDQQTPTTVILRGANNQRTLINRDDIEELQALRTSLMPDGLLDKLSDEEIRDLFAFVMAKTPPTGSAPAAP